MNSQTPSIVLFDGECSFCDSSVQFILKRDPAGRFRYAALQSEAARRLLTGHDIDPSRLDSIVLLEEGRCYTESTAALRIARHLQGWPRWAAPLHIVPRPIRDGVYRFVARHRYRWFGRRDQCLLPPPDIRRRFLE
ncbi:thiol-disulfide oxidoreductase DCC family protein [Paenibacillus koleovorans]|uniref:thiol-disulfide oxidoreductase DCC family protein n=1 Tax=Paenibacillus koleovorans TaxID=121608 RepID=UPI000FDB2A9F|nr:thiol-disulfide oxidoreductase DCC family protein [Paenibacillus koleovorans]